MKALFVSLAIALVLAFAGQSAPAAGKPLAWPDGAQAAVSLSYDDAIKSQLDNAIPALNKYGFKGTFNLVLSSDTVSKRLVEWRQAATQGHEWVTVDNDLDKVSVGQLAAQIRLGNTMLHAIDGKTQRTFAVPCGDLRAAGDNYIAAIKSDFVAIKSTPGGVTPDMWTLDPYAVSTAAPTNVTGEQLIAIAREAAAKGTMANFTFHGVGGDYLAVSSEAHEELLKFLADNWGTYWTDTFINIMMYVKNEQNHAP